MIRFTAGIAALCCCVPIVQAKVTAEEAAKLGAELTPLGALQVGNEDGSIPAWEGGIKEPPEDYDPEKPHTDPFRDDEPTVVLTSQNYEEHAQFLTEGQKALFKTYPDSYKMPIYETRRSASFPDELHKWTKENATKVELVNDGNGIKGTVAGYPFPIPQHGQEVMWNHLLRHIGVQGVDRNTNTATVQKNGDYELGENRQRINLYYGNPDKYPDEKSLDNRYVKIIVQILAPPKDAGEGYLIHLPIDRIKEPARAWVYNSGTKRVKKFTDIGYDGTANDGLMTHDQFTQFNGPLDRYNFKIVGKREVYIPYNSYKIHSGDVEYDDIVKRGHPNADLTRYEKHRVWVVEATLRDGVTHIYTKRVFYVDEDSWNIAAQDIYDAQDQFWRYGEGHLVNLYNQPTIFPSVEAHYDIQSKRYVLVGMTNKTDPPDFTFYEKDSFYTPNRMRRIMDR